jgi:hypothetical protein
MSIAENRNFRLRCNELLAELRPTLANARTGAPAAMLTEETIEAMDRTEQILAIATTSLSSPAVERLASREHLSQLHLQLEAVARYYRTAETDPRAAVANASGHLESLITHLSNVVSILNSSGVIGLADAESTRQQLELNRSRLAQNAQELQRLETSRKEVAERFETLNQQVQSFLADKNDSFLSTQTAREEGVRKLLEESRAKFDELGGQISEKEAQRASQAEAALADFGKRTENEVQKLDAIRNGRLEDLEKLHSQVRELVGAIGETAQAGGYEQVAAHAENRAIFWEFGTVVTMVLVVVVAWYSVFFEEGKPFDAVRSIGKLVLIVALGLLSRYSATVANRARREHLWAKQRGLELRALAAYLENFDANSRTELRKQLIDAYFGAGSTMLMEVASKDPAPTSSHDAVIELLTMLAKTSPQSLGKLVAAAVPRPDEPQRK